MIKSFGSKFSRSKKDFDQKIISRFFRSLGTVFSPVPDFNARPVRSQNELLQVIDALVEFDCLNN